MARTNLTPARHDSFNTDGSTDAAPALSSSHMGMIIGGAGAVVLLGGGGPRAQWLLEMYLSFVRGRFLPGGQVFYCEKTLNGPIEVVWTTKARFEFFTAPRDRIIVLRVVVWFMSQMLFRFAALQGFASLEEARSMLCGYTTFANCHWRSNET